MGLLLIKLIYCRIVSVLTLLIIWANNPTCILHPDSRGLNTGAKIVNLFHIRKLFWWKSVGVECRVWRASSQFRGRTIGATVSEHPITPRALSGTPQSLEARITRGLAARTAPCNRGIHPWESSIRACRGGYELDWRSTCELGERETGD